MLARPRPAKPRGTKRRTLIAPSVLLAKYEICRQGAAAIQEEIESKAQRRTEDEWLQTLRSLAGEVYLFPPPTDVEVVNRPGFPGDLFR
jgi:hypothetical protein